MTTFPIIATRGHRPRKDAEARVMLSGSTVKPSTAALIQRLIDATGDSRGEVIDRLVAQALTGVRLPTAQAIAAAPLSTAATAAPNSQSLRVQRVVTPLSSVKSKYNVSKSKS